MLNKKLIKPIRIAISGKSGCGNTSVGAYLAHQLGIRQINYTFRNLATDEGLTFQEIRRQAELSDNWDRLLDQRQVAMAMQESCVLGSRLAIWMLKEADIKVFLNISLEERSRRIHLREQGSPMQKMKETAERDKLDHDRYLKIYQIDNDNFSFADLIIDDGCLGVEEIAQKIIEAIPPNYFI